MNYFYKIEGTSKIDVRFYYSESCKNVYKQFGVFINGKRSNIVGLKKYLKHFGAAPSILTANTYFWTPAGNSSNRRRNEERHREAVTSYFVSEGFTFKSKLD